MVNFGRGDVLAAGGAQAGTGPIGTTTAATAAADAGGGVSRAGGDAPEEAKSLDGLYADARHEGGKLVIYAGGDTADQQVGPDRRRPRRRAQARSGSIPTRISTVAPR
jgi:hypothetical protein